MMYSFSALIGQHFFCIEDLFYVGAEQTTGENHPTLLLGLSGKVFDFPMDSEEILKRELTEITGLWVKYKDIGTENTFYNDVEYGKNQKT